MKTIILFIAVLISFGAKAQLSADSISKPKFMGVDYMLIDTFTKGSVGDIDTLMYSEIIHKNNVQFDSIPKAIIPNNDTTYKRTDNYRFDWLYSVKVVRYRMVNKYVMVKTVRPVKLQMYDLAKKRKQLNYPVGSFWEHSKVKAITEPEIIEEIE
jgi:hypothetical protein